MRRWTRATIETRTRRKARARRVVRGVTRREMWMMMNLLSPTELTVKARGC